MPRRGRDASDSGAVVPAVLASALVWTMVFSTVQLYAIAVLASELRDDLGVTRAQIGIIGAANTGVGALMSPYAGRIVDRIGAKQGALAVVSLGAMGMFATAAAQTYPMLLAASVVAGLGQSGGNPSTNKLISLHMPAGRRGAITGVKQSGVTLALFLSGLTLPGAAQLLGWRTSVMLYGVLSLVVAGAMFVALPPDPETRERVSRGESRRPLARFVYRVTVFAFLMGISTSGMLRFLALFAEEKLDYSETTAGLAVALVGLAGIAARISWGRLAEHHIGTRSALVGLACMAAASAGLLALAPSVGAWLIWPICLLIAGSAVAWNAVANLAIITGVRQADAGRATGVMLFGFLTGLSIGAPIAGGIVDATDQYGLAWLVVAVAALLAAAVVATGGEAPRAVSIGSAPA